MVLAPSSFLSFINPLLEKMQDTAPFLAMKDVLGLNIFFLTAVGAWGIFLGYLKSSYHGDMDEKWPVVLGMVLGCIAVAADFLWEVIQDYVYVCSEDLAEPEEGALPDTADDWGWRQFFNVNRKYVGIYWMALGPKSTFQLQKLGKLSKFCCWFLLVSDSFIRLAGNGLLFCIFVWDTLSQLGWQPVFEKYTEFHSNSSASKSEEWSVDSGYLIALTVISGVRTVWAFSYKSWEEPKKADDAADV